MGRYSPTVQPVAFDLGAALAPLGELADKWTADKRIARAQALQTEQARLGREHDVNLENMREIHDTAEAGLNRAERHKLQIGQFAHEDTMQGRSLKSEEERAAADQATRIYLGTMTDRTSRFIANQSNQTQRYGIDRNYDIANRGLSLEGIRTGLAVQEGASTIRERDALAGAATRRGGIRPQDVIDASKVVSPYGFQGDSLELDALDKLTQRAAGVVGTTPAPATGVPARGAAPAAELSPLQRHTEYMSPEEIASAIRRQTSPRDYNNVILTHVHPSKQAAVRQLLSGR